MTIHSRLIHFLIFVLFVAAISVSGEEEAAGEKREAGCPEEDRLRARAEELEKELGEVNGQLENARNEWSSTEANLRKEAENCQAQLAAPQDKLREVEEQLNQVTNERNGLRDETERLSSRLEEKAKYHDEVKRKLESSSSEFETEKERLHDTHKATANQLKSTHDQLLQAKHDKMEAEQRLKEITDTTIYKICKKISALYGSVKERFSGGGEL